MLNLPFPGDSGTPQIPTPYTMRKPKSIRPNTASNAHLLDLASRFQKDLPVSIEPKANMVRDFFLNELVPLTLAVQMGFEDGNEVFKNALGEEAESRLYAKALNEFVFEACVAKMFSFVSQYADLNQQEMEYYQMFFSNKVLPQRDPAHDYQALLSKVQSLLDVQGQKEKHAGSQMRQVQTHKGGARRGLRGVAP